MLIKLPKIDRKAALLAGYEVGPVCTVEVDMAALGDDRAALVEALELHEDGSATLGLVVPVPTVEAIVGAVRAAAADRAAQAAAAERGWRELLGEFEAAAAMLEQLEPVRCEKMLRDGNGSAIGVYSGWRKPDYREISVYDARAGGRAPLDLIAMPQYRAYHQAEVRLIGRARELDEAARQEALPAALEAHAEKVRLREAQLAAIEAQQEEAAREEAEHRLQTGYWERETDSYNQRRYGKPWCAKVAGVDGRGKLVYQWGEWTGRPGDCGLLRVECKPGEVIAWGQRDGRAPDKSEHRLARMDCSGRMHELSVVEAAKALRP